MKDKPLMPEYYNLPTWIINEFGFSREMGAYLIIYHFCRQGKTCYYSKSQWAKLLNCTPMQANRILKALESDKYIIAARRKSDTGNNYLSTEYVINEETAQEMQADALSITDAEPCNMDVTRGSNMDVTRGSNMDVTRGSNMDVIQSEYINQNIESEERESARANDTAVFSPIPNHEEIKLTAEQQRELQREVTGTGRSLESYFIAIERQMHSGKSYKSHFDVLRDWMQRDKDKAEQQRKAKGQSSSNSSIDDEMIEKIMDPYGLKSRSGSSSINDAVYQKIMDPYGAALGS